MDPSVPNEDEKRKLQKLAINFKLTIINIIILSGIYWIVRLFLDQYPVLQIAVYITMLVVTFFLLLKMTLLNKCPRCSSWGTPIMGGDCPKCGLRLASSNKER
ncbi:hypothetical protein ACFL1N_05180 [Thermodesulfobacteriota bacterium]